MLNPDINGLILELLSPKNMRNSVLQYMYNAEALTYLETAIYDSKTQNNHSKIQILTYILKDQHLAIKERYVPLMFYPENRQLMDEFIHEYQLQWYNEGGNLFMGCHNIGDGVYRFTIKPSRCLESYTRKIVGIFISGDFCQWKKSYQLICIKDDLYTITIKNIRPETGYKYFLIDNLGMKYWFKDPGNKMLEDMLNNKISSDVEASLEIYNKYMERNYFTKTDKEIECNFMIDLKKVGPLRLFSYQSVMVHGKSKSYFYRNTAEFKNIFDDVYVSNIKIPLILPDSSVCDYYSFKYRMQCGYTTIPWRTYFCYFLDENYGTINDEYLGKPVVNNIIRI